MSRVAFQRAFQELNEDEIAYLLENSRKVAFEDGDILIRENEDSGIILVILDGKVRVVRLQGGRRRSCPIPCPPATPLARCRSSITSAPAPP